MTALKFVRYAVWAAVVILGGAILWLVVSDRTGPGGEGGAIVAASIGGPFALTDQTGAPVTEAALQGHPSAMFFGYTYCPDVCPTTLADMTLWLESLGPNADKLKVYFVTVDPERDTKEKMAEYLTAFDPRIVGLTGSRIEIDTILKGYRVYSKKVGEGDGYTMDHTASVFLFDDKAKFVGTVDYQDKEEAVMAKLRRLVGA